MSLKEYEKFIDEILEIFNPWGGWGSDVYLVADLLKRGLLTYTAEEIEWEDVPENYHFLKGPGRETFGHL